MSDIKYDKQGKPVPIPEVEKFRILTEQVLGIVNREYSRGSVFDAIEELIKEQVKFNEKFALTRDNFSNTVFLVHDGDNPILHLLIGPRPAYRQTVLETFCSMLSGLIYEDGFKDEVVEIVYTSVLREMLNRFNRSTEYKVAGQIGETDEGLITRR